MQQRVERVASLLLREVSQAIIEDIQDERMGFLTVLRVDVTKDLKSAKLFYSVLGDAAKQALTEKLVTKKSKLIKRIVNDRIQMRYAIDLRFIRVDDQDESIRVQRLLERIQEERESKGPSETEES